MEEKGDKETPPVTKAIIGRVTQGYRDRRRTLVCPLTNERVNGGQGERLTRLPAVREPIPLAAAPVRYMARFERES